MKDSEFIALLNLYLDHEISAEDAVRLEAEVQSNPARRRIYQDYCRMQKACKVLGQDFQDTPDAADKKVVAFNPETAGRASRGNVFYTVGAVAAAAACVAIIFVGRSRQQEQVAASNASVAAVERAVPSAAPQPAGVAIVDTKSAPMAIDTPQAKGRAGGGVTIAALRHNDTLAPSFVGADALFLGQNTSASTTAEAQPENDQFKWLYSNLGLVSLEQQLQLEQMRFQTPPMTLRPEGSQLGNRAIKNKAQEPASEMVTFKLTLGR